MTDTRKPQYPPGRPAPRPSTTYEGESAFFNYPKPSCATVQELNLPPITARIRLTVSRPAIVRLHSSVTSQLTHVDDQWNGYYALDIPTQPFTDAAQPTFPLIAGRYAWFFAPGTWVIDISANTGVTLPSIDYDVMYVDDPRVAYALMQSEYSRDLPSQIYNHTQVVVPAAASTLVVDANNLLLSRGVLIQNIAAGTVDLTMDGVAGSGTRGIRLLANAERFFTGAEFFFTPVLAFSGAGTTLRVNLAQPGGRNF